MRRRFYRADDDAGVDMTPMLDLVFILLIFFIVSAVFLDESGIAFAETPDSDEELCMMPTILVQLDEADTAFIDGNRVSLRSIPARVEALRAHAQHATVSVQAQAKTSIAAVVFVKDRMDAAQIPVTIKVEE